jgi:Sulfotransferase domain
VIVSTPRSGNTWLRSLLVNAYALDRARNEELWAHSPEGFSWRDLPRRCVMQLHWEPNEAFHRLLRAHGVTAIALARHPLDVLISILQYSQHSAETACWLRGDGGDERTLPGALPCSETFLDYATGRRASVLLSLSVDWWQTRRSLNLRYEDLVRDPSRTLGQLTQTLGGGVSPEALSRAVASCTIDKLRTSENAPHFWQGKPGLWKALLTVEAAQHIAAAHPRAFEQFGYVCDADPSLTREQADMNWATLASAGRPRLQKSA